MMEFVILVLAFVAAYLLLCGMAIAFLFCKPAMKWFTKKYMKLVEEISDEIVDEMEKEDEIKEEKYLNYIG